MKPSLVFLAALVALATAGCGSYETGASRASRPVATQTSSSTVPARQLDGQPDTVIYGHIKSLTRRGGRFEMRFDPALWLGGVTAYRAAVEDKQIKPGEPVSNDYYIREESHRLLTYLVPATARLRVITELCCRYVQVTPAQLAQIVSGKNEKLGRYRSFGFWLRADLDTVRSLDQQYQP